MTVVLEQRRTEFQEVMLFESPRLGRVLALDGIVQMTDLDTYVYHEMLAHPALFSHPNPRDVAVVGGGDVHLVAEVLKHPGIERVYLLELDEEVVQVARKHYDVARETLADPRVEVRPSDAFESIAELHGELDVIMVDLTDPIGPAARLFEDEFYALCEQSLRADGMLVAQTESIHFHPDVVRELLHDAREPLRAHRSAVGRDRHLSGRVLDVRASRRSSTTRASCGAGRRSTPASTTSTPTSGSSSRSRCAAPARTLNPSRATTGGGTASTNSSAASMQSNSLGVRKWSTPAGRRAARRAARRRGARAGRRSRGRR